MAKMTPNYRKSLPRTIWVLGVISLLTDLSSEMIYPLLPIFLVQTIGASTSEVGFIEGFVEATSAILKRVIGKYSDRFEKKKSFVLFGYSLSSISRPLVALATSWPIVFFIRFTDRIRKGIRSAPRDVMIANACSKDQLGHAFGVHRAMDHMGAVIGPLIASILLSQFHFEIRSIFALSIIPAILTIFVLVFFLKEKQVSKENLAKSEGQEESENNTLDSKSVKTFLVSLGLFTLGNSTDAFMLLKFSEIGIGLSSIALLWSAHHVVKVLSNYYFGPLSDRVGHLSMIRYGWIFYVVVYLLFAYSTSEMALIATFLLYGIYYGLSEPSEKSYLVSLSSYHTRGASLGWMHMITGLGALPASVIFGLIWNAYGSEYAFFFGSLMAFIALMNTLRLKK